MRSSWPAAIKYFAVVLWVLDVIAITTNYLFKSYFFSCCFGIYKYVSVALTKFHPLAWMAHNEIIYLVFSGNIEQIVLHRKALNLLAFGLMVFEISMYLFLCLAMLWIFAHGSAQVKGRT